MLVVGLGIFGGLSPAAYCLSLTHTIQFPLETIAKDTASGNGIDYSYSHEFAQWDEIDEISSGILRLTHSGNLDEGPRAEIWFALSGSGDFIGKLERSEGMQITDQWQLAPSILAQLAGNGKLEVQLSEQTSFNSEAVNLFESELVIEYTAKNKTNAPHTPEPRGLLLLLLGLALGAAAKALLKVRA